MTYRTAGRTTRTRKTAKTRRTAKTTRTVRTRTPKPGQAFSVPVGHKTTMPSVWYFGR